MQLQTLERLSRPKGLEEGPDVSVQDGRSYNLQNKKTKIVCGCRLLSEENPSCYLSVRYYGKVAKPFSSSLSTAYLVVCRCGHCDYGKFRRLSKALGVWLNDFRQRQKLCQNLSSQGLRLRQQLMIFFVSQTVLKGKCHFLNHGMMVHKGSLLGRNKACLKRRGRALLHTGFKSSERDFKLGLIYQPNQV